MRNLSLSVIRVVLVLGLSLNVFGNEVKDENKALSHSYNASNTNRQYKNFVITTNKYSYKENLNQACKNEFGSDYRLADWNDIVSLYHDEGTLKHFFDKLGIPPHDSPDAQSYMVSYNGNEFYDSNRHYLISRHDHKKPSNYLDHANINNYELSLGSWYGSRKVLCYKYRSNGSSSNDSQEEYQKGFEAGKLFCQQNPEKCGIQKESQKFGDMTPKETVINAIKNKSFPLSGYYIHYGQGVFDWIYVSKNLSVVAKLEKGCNAKDGSLRWNFIQTSKNNPVFESIELQNGTIKFGNKIEVPGTR